MPRNQYAANCFRCGEMVKAGEGHFERVGRIQREKYGTLVRGKKWITQHAECAIKHRGTNHNAAQEATDE